MNYIRKKNDTCSKEDILLISDESYPNRVLTDEIRVLRIKVGNKILL